MGILDILKGKKEEVLAGVQPGGVKKSKKPAKKVGEKVASARTDENKETVAEEKTEEKKTAKAVKLGGEAHKILIRPHVTEKATDLTGDNMYIFEVNGRANKQMVKKAVKNVYGVEVAGVNIINVPRKSRRLGRHTGFRKGYKKAMVILKEGEKIEIMPR